MAVQLEGEHGDARGDDRNACRPRKQVERLSSRANACRLEISQRTRQWLRFDFVEEGPQAGLEAGINLRHL
jgi:hypothetical protein